MKANSNIIIEEENPDSIKQALQKGLREYNYEFLGQYESQKFAIYIKDEETQVIAGIYGFIIAKHKTMRLEFVWVHENARNKGIGTQLLKYIDEYAISKGCEAVQVSTMEFQGKEFYGKMGYKQIGLIPKWFCDKDEIFFLKKL